MIVVNLLNRRIEPCDWIDSIGGGLDLLHWKKRTPLEESEAQPAAPIHLLKSRHLDSRGKGNGSGRNQQLAAMCLKVGSAGGHGRAGTRAVGIYRLLFENAINEDHEVGMRHPRNSTEIGVQTGVS